MAPPAVTVTMFEPVTTVVVGVPAAAVALGTSPLALFELPALGLAGGLRLGFVVRGLDLAMGAAGLRAGCLAVARDRCCRSSVVWVLAVFAGAGGATAALSTGSAGTVAMGGARLATGAAGSNA